MVLVKLEFPATGICKLTFPPSYEVFGSCACREGRLLTGPKRCSSVAKTSIGLPGCFAASSATAFASFF